MRGQGEYKNLFKGTSADVGVFFFPFSCPKFFPSKFAFEISSALITSLFIFTSRLQPGINVSLLFCEMLILKAGEKLEKQSL